MTNYMALDVGEKRIGVALADSEVKIAIPFGVIEVNGKEVFEVNRLIIDEKIDILVVGLPRNQQGEETNQSGFSRRFAANFELSVPKIVFQDESLTSVLAEQQLKAMDQPYSKGDIDAWAAGMILQDYLEAHTK
ncbi:Holliday junction resolvase RuvX [Candidatus Saccharibacteria bacterium]|nr:Holliday junction resolvase RuvX [Candidatus Saccharibacteria bacterium]